MRHERIDLWTAGEYDYPDAFGFMPNLRTYLREEGPALPCVLVIPGGGYRFTSPSEGENVAKKFFDLGYQTFVGCYSTDLAGYAPLKTQPLKDISRMIRIIRSRAEEFRVRPDQIVICGFSAGAHLCGSLCVHWQDAPDAAYPEISNRPDGAILSYPVITSGEFAHRDSFTALLGPEATEEELRYMSLETQVNPETPPIFLWQTATDESVPVENSYLMAMALKKAGIPFEHHVFPKGHHGISLADQDWAEHRVGDTYPLEASFCVDRAAREGKIQVTEGQREFLNYLTARQTGDVPPDHPVPEAAIWPNLADTWMRGLF